VVTTILALSCGVGVGVGLITIVIAIRSDSEEEALKQGLAGLAVDDGKGRLIPRRLGPKAFRILLSLMLGLLVGTVTRWPVAGVLTAAGSVGLPSFMKATRRGNRTVRTEAIATWTEFLRDTLAAASGLSQAIIATASVSPEPIHEEVGALAARLATGMHMSEALRMFADELADPSADLVVCALMLATEVRAQRLVDLLGTLSESMREEVAMRLRVDAGRTSARSGVRTIVLFSGCFAAIIALVARAYLEPFASSQGEVALLVAGAFDAAGIVLMTRLVRDPSPLRLLGGANPVEARL